MNKEAEELTNAAKYERTESRQGYRSGHYNRKLTTTSGEVTLHIPKLKGVPFKKPSLSATVAVKARLRKP